MSPEEQQEILGLVLNRAERMLEIINRFEEAASVKSAAAVPEEEAR